MLLIFFFSQLSASGLPIFRRLNPDLYWYLISSGKSATGAINQSRWFLYIHVSGITLSGSNQSRSPIPFLWHASLTGFIPCGNLIGSGSKLPVLSAQFLFTSENHPVSIH